MFRLWSPIRSLTLTWKVLILVIRVSPFHDLRPFFGERRIIRQHDVNRAAWVIGFADDQYLLLFVVEIEVERVQVEEGLVGFQRNRTCCPGSDSSIRSGFRQSLGFAPASSVRNLTGSSLALSWIEEM